MLKNDAKRLILGLFEAYNEEDCDLSLESMRKVRGPSLIK